MSWTCTSCGEENNWSKTACNCCGFAKPQAFAEEVNILLIGNPGVGKNTIFNGLIMKPHFKSGISFGGGLTYQLDIYKPPGQSITYMDTPGLDDTMRRKRAAEEITKALQQGGHYKIFFVLTLEGGRVKSQDVTTMELVLEAAPITSFGIIINKLEGAVLEQLKHNPEGLNPSPKDLVLQCLWHRFQPHQQTRHVHFLESLTELVGKKNVVRRPPSDLIAFIELMPGMIIEPPSVRNVKDNLFEEKMAEIEAQNARLLAENGTVQEALNLTNSEYVELKKKVADMERNKADEAKKIEKDMSQPLKEYQDLQNMLSETLQASDKDKKLIDALTSQLQTCKLQEQINQIVKEKNDAPQRVQDMEKTCKGLEQRLREQDERGIFDGLKHRIKKTFGF